MAEEFVPLAKAAEELGVAPDALKQVIAKRELAAFLDGGTFKIRRSDLDRYKQRRQSEETVVLPAEEVAEDAGEEVMEAVLVEEAPAPEPAAEPTLEAIEEVSETVDTEITLDELDAVKEEPATETAAEPVALESGDGEATQEIALSDELAFADEVGLEDEAKTVSLESGKEATTEPLEVGEEETSPDLAGVGEEAGDEGGLESRVHVLEVRPQGSPFFSAMAVLTCLVLLYVGMALWGLPLDYVPSYLEWVVKP